MSRNETSSQEIYKVTANATVLVQNDTLAPGRLRSVWVPLFRAVVQVCHITVWTMETEEVSELSVLNIPGLILQ